MASLPKSTSKAQKKVIFILGSTATGKSKLAINLALQFNGEVINSDKMQIYYGLDVITNKVTPDECAGVPHHLLGFVHPNDDFTADDFRVAATQAVDDILARGRLPIIAGGSNTYIKELVDGKDGEFGACYDSCFIWVDVEPEVLEKYVAERLEKAVERGLVEEARGVFDVKNVDYSKGIRRSIGVAEMDGYLRREGEVEGEERGRLREKALEEIKENTWKLAREQRRKIVKFVKEDGWRVWRVDATKAIVWGEMKEVWEEVVWKPSAGIVREFLEDGRERDVEERGGVGWGAGGNDILSLECEDCD
ncbi:adenylate isopentenyltransferase 5, chloroplastic-like [Phalaenopsis equestris]|uniref:adenylate isopentenyltransferase 5, chloroplastic-like n=1 Tax=Phalaenopsis equestris TaxID=78828 RepID=UPI0009E374BC|nr:adenylate isopentenyltransferase 5, chloroplastic-like [Phalaenopsis equestris]